MAAILGLGLFGPALADQSATITLGTNFTISVTAAGTTPFTYEWSKNGSPISGATQASLVFTNAQSSDAGNYTVKVSNSGGSTTSDTAIISTAGVFFVGVAPAITTQPATTQTVIAGNSATFTVVATGAEAPTYQWRKGGVNIANGGNISGATSATLTLTNVALTDSGTYTVVATNSVGTATSTNSDLTVISGIPPTITTQPTATQTVITGSSATFTVVATGTPAPTYQWRKGGVNIANGGNITGATSASLTLTSVALTDSGTYTVVASNSAGTATSNNSDLTVNSGIPPTVPPTITTQPVSTQTITVSSNVTLSAAASGTPAPTYQWRKGGVNIANGGNITGATSADLTLSNVALTDSGTYTVVATNSAGTATSSNSVLNVISGTSSTATPTITTQPATQTVSAGTSATLTVVAAGTTPFTYQWSKDGSPITGATLASLSITNAQSSDAGNYKVMVTNSAGAITSNTATITITGGTFFVGVAPAITTQPTATQTVVVGNSATFTVVATGTEAPTYQWQKGGVNIIGATSATLTLNNVGASDTGTYTVVVTNSVGTVTSSNSALTVISGIPPTITTQPTATQTVIAGSSATFTVVATGTPAPTYQWQKGGVSIAGATSSTVTLGAVTLADAGTYTVVVTNGAGTVTSTNAALNVNGPPAITTQPVVAQTIVIGNAATFTASASGVPSPTYQWQKNGTNIGGATSATYTIPSVTLADGATYTVIASNGIGSPATSNSSILIVSTPPAITTQPVASQTLVAGSSVTFAVAASGIPSPTYQWRVNGVNISGAFSATYNIPSVTLVNAGTYTVVATNAAGTATSANAVLTVHTPPAITSQPVSTQTITVNTNVTLSAAASGTPAPTYQWQKDGVNIANGGIYSGATSSALTLTNVAVTDTGNYTVVATNSVGSATSSNSALNVIIGTPPTITTQPAATQTVIAGNGATFTVVATGAPAPTYQWQKGGVNVAGATSSSLTFGAATLTDAGTYTVVVTNSVGTIGSNNAVLIVNGLPAFTSQPTAATVGAGKSVSFHAAATQNATYQWQESTNNGTTWTTLTNNSTYSDTTTSTLTISGATAAMNGNQYRVIATNGNSSTLITTSAVATLTVIASAFNSPVDVAVGTGSNLLVSDNSSNTIQSVNAAGTATLLAGISGQQGAIDGPGSTAVFRQPGAVVLDAAGNLFVADTGNSLIRKITASGETSTVAGAFNVQGYRDATGVGAWFNMPAGIAIDSAGNLYVADTGNFVIRKITVAGAVTTFAGTAGFRGSTDGTGAAAKFNQPSGLTVDGAGNIYVADTLNHTIRRITPAGVVSTVAGLPGVVGIDDGNGLTQALFNRPVGVTVDGAGTLYVSDTGNSTIRRITASGTVSTLAGLPTISGLKDGTGTDAWFNQPMGLRLDGNGNLYVADNGNAAIRRISVTGAVTTLAIVKSAAPPTPTPTPTPSPSDPPSSSGLIGSGGATSPWFLLALLTAGVLRFRKSLTRPRG